MKTVKVHVDIDKRGMSHMYSAKPDDAWRIKNRFTDHSTIQDRTIDDVADLLAHGVTIQPGVTPFSKASLKKAQERAKKEGKKCIPGTVSDDFKSQDLFFSDMDNETIEPIAPGDAVATLAKYNLRPAFLYETFSSTEDNIRFRVVLVSDETFTDKTERDRAQLGLIKLFDGPTDSTCRDASRIFYGTNKGLIPKFTDFGAECKKADLLALADAMEIPADPEAIKNFDLESALREYGDGGTVGALIPVGARHGTLLSYACARLTRLGITEEAHEQYLARVKDCDAPTGARIIAESEVNRIWRDACAYYTDVISKKPGYIPPKDYRPQRGPGRPSKPRLTMAELAAIMQRGGDSVRLDVISGMYITSGRTPAGRHGKDVSLDDITTMYYDRLVDTYKDVSPHKLEQYVAFLGREHQFNPVLDFLKTVTWDGVDRTPQIYTFLGIDDDDLSKTLVYKWLLQTVALLFNGEDGQAPFGADGCLTLKGGQGWSKTSFFRRLGLEWFGEGKELNSFDKDTRRRIVTKWITELGEVETTLRSDLEDLKNFISAPFDEYRLPYGRADVARPRHTSLCATCNSDKYLIDVTGNRRWWTVPLAGARDYSEVEALDAVQLWAQIYAVVAPLPYEHKSKCFRLTSAERDQLAKRNGRYEKPVKAQDEVQDILARAEREHLSWERMTVTDFQQYWPAELRRYTTQQIGVALKRCGVLDDDRTGRDRFKLLPTPFKESKQ